MTGSVIFSEDAAPIEWSETEPFKLEFGPKAATFAALPKEWTPPFALISASVITGSKQDGLARHVLGENIVSRIRELAKNTGRIYIRSSIIGETIWDRGSYDSVIVDLVSKDFKAALNIPLPWGKEASEQQAATTQLGAAQQRYDAALLDIQSALGEALARLKAARQADALVARKALPEARAALKSITTDYAQGRGDLATALDAQHRAHDLELRLLQLELDEQTMLAAIERLIGGEL